MKEEFEVYRRRVDVFRKNYLWYFLWVLYIFISMIISFFLCTIHPLGIVYVILMVLLSLKLRRYITPIQRTSFYKYKTSVANICKLDHDRYQIVQINDAVITYINKKDYKKYQIYKSN